SQRHKARRFRSPDDTPGDRRRSCKCALYLSRRARRNRSLGNGRSARSAETRTCRTHCTMAAANGALSPLPRTLWFPGLDAERAFQAWYLPPRPSRPAQYESGMTHLIAAMTRDESNLRVFHLPFGRIGAAKLAHALDDLQHAFDMGFR